MPNEQAVSRTQDVADALAQISPDALASFRVAVTLAKETNGAGDLAATTLALDTMAKEGKAGNNTPLTAPYAATNDKAHDQVVTDLNDLAAKQKANAPLEVVNAARGKAIEDAVNLSSAQVLDASVQRLNDPNVQAGVKAIVGDGGLKDDIAATNDYRSALKAVAEHKPADFAKVGAEFKKFGEETTAAIRDAVKGVVATGGQAQLEAPQAPANSAGKARQTAPSGIAG